MILSRHRRAVAMHRFGAICLLPAWAIVATCSPAAWGDGRDTPPVEVEVDPLASIEHNKLGLDSVRAKHFAVALREFTEAVRFNPENAMARKPRDRDISRFDNLDAMDKLFPGLVRQIEPAGSASMTARLSDRPEM